MKIKEISYLLPPADLIDDCLDVTVDLEDEDSGDKFSYLVEVTTPECLSALIEESESDFLPTSYPYIIVSKLTNEIITEAMEAYLSDEDDAYWLKLYHVAASLEIEDLNEIIARKKQENLESQTEIDAAIDADIEILRRKKQEKIELDAEPDINN